MLTNKLYTLVFLQKGCYLLLGWKKHGFGKNVWNGFGGKVEKNETIAQGAVRELKEECDVNVKINNLKNIGRLEFTFEGDQVLMDVNIFSASIFDGVPKESEEMAPKWFRLDHIPYHEMWPDNKIWYPYMFKNKCFHGKFHYHGLKKILYYRINELESMHN